MANRTAILKNSLKTIAIEIFAKRETGVIVRKSVRQTELINCAPDLFLTQDIVSIKEIDILAVIVVA